MKPELLAPAGNWQMLTAAVNSGADAVYFGVNKLNMRAKANNFKLDELKDVTDYCHSKNVDAHLTLNTIVYENELDEVDQVVKAAKDANIDLIICWDMAVIQKCMDHEVPFCISTQASISNTASAKMYKRLGAKRIVLARECTLEKIKEIKTDSKIDIETFIHGAMCVAVSGRCFMSHSVFGKSANRGECIQPCRRDYTVYDSDGDKEFILGEDYVMSPKDLCSIQFIDQLIEAGIDSFKIEGRKRSPEYITKVVSTYRKAIDLYFEGKLSSEIKRRNV
jgi:putative protease